MMNLGRKMRSYNFSTPLESNTDQLQTVVRGHIDDATVMKAKLQNFVLCRRKLMEMVLNSMHI